MRKLGLYDTIWPMVLLPAVSVYLMIIARTFFQTTIPDELLAAAQIDGCSNRQFFMLVVIPVSAGDHRGAHPVLRRETTGTSSFCP